MIELSFNGDVALLETGIAELASSLDVVSVESGMETESRIAVVVTQASGNLSVEWDGGHQAKIGFERTIHFYRALGLLTQGIRNGAAFQIQESPAFSSSTVMLDASRNAVLTPASLRCLLRIFALMGIDSVMLYTEDTYEIEGMPFFGYMRGRYSFEELKAADDYAALFGIEMFPCIQTLGHLQQVLKWSAYAPVRDTSDILLVDEPATYELIDAMIASATRPFRSKRIHIGMDEAHALGTGEYLNRHGYHSRFDIMASHLSQVLEIVAKHGLEPLIWSDMYFRLGSKDSDYYDIDSDIPDEVKASVPAGVKLVYWDYYHTDKEFYREWIMRHKELGSTPIFAGGIWSWIGHCVSLGASRVSLIAAMEACREEGISEFFMTQWGDDGNESNIFAALPALQHFAELLYGKTIDDENLKQRFSLCTGGTWDEFQLLQFIDEAPGTSPGNHWPSVSNPSKFALWQDPLMGLFDKNIAPYELGAHYAALAPQFERIARTGGPWQNVFAVSAALCRVLELKAELGLKLHRYYDAGDRAALKRVVALELVDLQKRVEALRFAHRQQWFETYKAFGWEVLDIRYGGLIARLQSTSWRIECYLAGQIDCIEELEAQQLFFDSLELPSEIGLWNNYRRMVTAGVN